MLLGCSCSLAARMPTRPRFELFWVANEAPERLRAFGAQFFLPSIGSPPRWTKARVHIRFFDRCIIAKLTLQNYFYSILHNFLNLEIVNNFILEEDYKLRAAMYDVDPTDPR